ncbi:tetratricopeptide repeat protein, partial [bacterium]|nr:tetratricopeptide repeat protein [bacterium]
MSPEQVEGKDVDQRSDIYSLGVMLYEIVTGKVPFEGDTPLSIAIMHKSEEPRDPRELNRNISEDLSNVILRCMEKDREKRYQGAEELFSELIKIEKGMPTTEKILPKRKRKPEKTAEIRWKIAILHGVLIGSIFIIILIILMTYFGLKFSYKPQEVIDSIAVLPLKNLSGVAEKEYLAERMTRALIDEMTKTEALRRVTPITSVMQYKTTPKRLAEIGKELDVQAVVEWSMLLVGQKLRITIKLIDAKKEKPLWNKIYEQDMIDDLASQSELARTISHEIIVELTAEELPFLEKTRPDVKPKALQLYKKGRFYWNQRPYEVFKAQEYFTHAIQEDPKCALAYAGWADCDLPTPYNFVWHPKKQINWVKENIEKALEIDRYLGEACASQAWIKMYYEGDWEGAERQFKRAIMLNPNYTTAHQWYANYMMNLGRFDEARKEMERALELDPLSPIINCDLGRVLYYSSQYELAIEAFQKTIEIDPNFFLAYHYLGIVYIQKSMYDEALAEFQKEKVSIKERPTSIHLPFIIDTWIGITYLKMGKRLEVQGVLSELMKRSKHLWSVPYSMAILYFSLGERDEGFKWLKKAYEQRDYRLCLLKIDPVFDSIRSDPRFKEMLKKVGLER